MKLSQILKIGGSIVGGLAGVALIFNLLGEILQHPVLVSIIILGGLAYFAGVYFKNQKK
jgi:hypothetical protein